MEWEWHQWLPKLESLLRDLFWTETYLHLITDATVGNHDYVYRACDVGARFFDAEPPLPVASWEFSGGPRELSL